jgi:hypothetical protein
MGKRKTGFFTNYLQFARRQSTCRPIWRTIHDWLRTATQAIPGQEDP